MTRLVQNYIGPDITVSGRDQISPGPLCKKIDVDLVTKRSDPGPKGPYTCGRLLIYFLSS